MYDGGRDEYYEFTDVNELCEFIKSKAILIYAHNGGKFDYHFMKPHFNDDETIMVIGQRIAKFRIGEAELRDSVNLLPIALRDFQKDDIDYAIMEAEERHKPHNWRTIQLYLKSDCVNLYNIVREFLTRFGKNLTQAGASMKYWSKMSGIDPPRQSKYRYQEIKPFYYGGRVQCFKSGYRETPFKVIDINSAYPYAMTFKHPFSVEFDSGSKLPKLEADIQTSLIRLTAISKGALPLRGEDGALYFPDDERRAREYRITGWEYLAGLETGTLEPVRIREVVTFREKVSFGDYVAEFYEQRKKAKAIGDKAGDIFAKIFMNGLYGKFAADPSHYHEYAIVHPDDRERWQGDGFEFHSEWDAERSLYWRPLPEVKHRYYNIATAASITGFVRAYLWRAVQKCSGVIYCDTDSIAATNTGTLALGNNLGEWKIEKECDAYAVAGKKLYAFRGAGGDEWKTASKGVDLTAEEIVRIARGGRVTYQPEVPTFSAHRPMPIFIPRVIVSTARDISKVPAAIGCPWLASAKKAA